MRTENINSTLETNRESLETTRSTSSDIQLAMRVDVGEAGSFEGMASVAGSIANGAKGQVTFKPGAFSETLSDKGGVFPLLWQHEDARPIGKVRLVETSEGLKAYGQITQNSQGKEITELLRDGVPLGLSIGFNPEMAAYEKHAGTGTLIRCVSKARLKETSIVTFPADPNATIRVVHSDGEVEITTPEPRERHAAIEPIVGSLDASNDDRELVAELLDVVIDDTTLEIHAGRVFSEKNLDRMRLMAEALQDLIAMADPLFATTLLPKYAPAAPTDSPEGPLDESEETPAEPACVEEAIEKAEATVSIAKMLEAEPDYILKEKVDAFLRENQIEEIEEFLGESVAKHSAGNKSARVTIFEQMMEAEIAGIESFLGTKNSIGGESLASNTR